MDEQLDVKAFVQKKAVLTYPFFELGEVTEVTRIIVTLLERGDIPLVGSHAGKRAVILRISPSLDNVYSLLGTHESVTFHRTENESVTLSCIVDYMEAVDGLNFDGTDCTGTGNS